MEAEQTAALVAALENLNSGVAKVEEDLANTFATLDALVEANRNLAEKIDHIPQYTKAVQTLTNEVVHLRTDFNRWLNSEAEQKSDIRKRLKDLEDGKRNNAPGTSSG